MLPKGGNDVSMFLQLLALVAPSFWVFFSGAAGVGIGYFGKHYLQSKRNDRSSRSNYSGAAGKISRRDTSGGASDSGARKSRPPAGRKRRGRSSS